MAIEVVPFISVPVGQMRCIACSDNKRHPGKMWLGINRHTHEDIVIDCPKCGGSGLVDRFKHIDVRTGQEIDYEKPGQKFINLEDSTHG